MKFTTISKYMNFQLKVTGIRSGKFKIKICLIEKERDTWLKLYRLKALNS